MGQRRFCRKLCPSEARYQGLKGRILRLFEKKFLLNSGVRASAILIMIADATLCSVLGVISVILIFQCVL